MLCILFFAAILAFYFNLEADRKIQSYQEPLLTKDVESGDYDRDISEIPRKGASEVPRKSNYNKDAMFTPEGESKQQFDENFTQ